MALIAEFLGRNPRTIRVGEAGGVLPAIARLGFELELEKHQGDWAEVDGWVQTDDGSLRGRRVEYIFDGPAGGLLAEERINNMVRYLMDSPPAPTFRCSTHLHMDMSTADWNVYEKTVLAYMVFEDAFFDQVDRERRHSNFCIPFINNDWLSSYFGRNVLGQTSENHKYHFIQRWSKYSALNLNVTAVHGTIEFRGSHALTTSEEFLGVALRMLSLRKMAEAYKDMANVDYVNMLANNGIPEFIPGSFPAGYAPDPGGLDMGLASALLAISAGELESNMELRNAAEAERERQRIQQEREQEERRQRQQLVRQAAATRVQPNVEAYAAVHIATPHLNTVRGVVEQVRALRGVGINTTVTALVQPNRAVAAALEILSRNLDDSRQFIAGLTIEELQ